MADRLPDFVSPMLAVTGVPFDSEDFFFEFKWDGFRTAAYIENGSCRLMSRKAIDMSGRFPNLAVLASLPDGTVMDGEVVLIKNGKPFFEGLLDGGRGPGVIRFVAFDILYWAFHPVMDLHFSERRARLEKVVEVFQGKELMLSDGISTNGKSLYAKACELDLEGVMAKRLSSSYVAGKRSESWVKIKRRLKTQVVVIGFVEKGANDFKSLLVAGNGLPGQEYEGLRYMGKVGGGFSEEAKARMSILLHANPRSSPIVPCREKAKWIEPRLYCTVSFTELTSQGLLRAPVFERLVEG